MTPEQVSISHNSISCLVKPQILLDVVITGCNDNDNMMSVVKLVVVFMMNFAMNKMMFRVMNE